MVSFTYLLISCSVDAPNEDGGSYKEFATDDGYIPPPPPPPPGGGLIKPKP